MAGAGETLYLGVDAGATRCRARLRASSGDWLAEGEGPAANAYVDFEAAIGVVREVLAQTLAQVRSREARTSCIRLGLGVAGIGNPDEAGRFAAAFDGYAGTRAVNDAVTACIGAHAGEDGGLVIVGTGSAGLARVRGQETIFGGRGFLLGDDGSAARIGADALRAAMRAYDGLGPGSGLTRAVWSRFDDPRAMLRWAPGAKPGDYGAFAPLVLEAAAAGDAVARPIVEAAIAAIAALVAAIETRGAERIAMVGGLGAAIRPFLPEPLAEKLRPPRFDPTDGAILLAGGRVAEEARS